MFIIYSRYNKKNIETVCKEDKSIDYVVGHSGGGSATLELERNFPERKITSVTYNAPVFEQADADKLLDEDENHMRFAISGDPVSMFDMNAQTTVKAPDFNVDAVTNVASAYANPSFENVVKTANTSNFDPYLACIKFRVPIVPRLLQKTS